jgi:hypothetical protein
MERNPFKGLPKWYETAWLVFDTQSDMEFRDHWRKVIAPKLEKLIGKRKATGK